MDLYTRTIAGQPGDGAICVRLFRVSGENFTTPTEIQTSTGSTQRFASDSWHIAEWDRHTFSWSLASSNRSNSRCSCSLIDMPARTDA